MFGEVKNIEKSLYSTYFKQIVRLFRADISALDAFLSSEEIKPYLSEIFSLKFENGLTILQSLLGLKVKDGFKKFKLLVEYGADIHQTGKAEETVLMYAAELGLPKMVEFLIENGADVNDVNSQNISALWIAKSERKNKVVKILLSHGADPAIVPFSKRSSHIGKKSSSKELSFSEKSSLHKAISNANFPLIKNLLINGAKPTIEDLEYARDLSIEYRDKLPRTVYSKYDDVYMSWELHIKYISHILYKNYINYSDPDAFISTNNAVLEDLTDPTYNYYNLETTTIGESLVESDYMMDLDD